MSTLFGEPDALDAVVAELRRFPGWPADDAKDRAFAQEVVDGFRGIDLVAEIAAWRVWMMDHDPKGKGVRPRARVHRWLRQAADSARRGNGRSSAGARRSGTAPRSAAEHGPTTDDLTTW